MKNKILAIALLASLTACMDSAPGSDDHGVETTDRIILNSLLPSQIQNTTLGNAPLTAKAVNPYAQTTDGQQYLTYLIGCALASNQSITVTVGLAKNVVIPGVMGLTSAWTTRALTAQERQYVSACVMSRTNYFGDPISISDRGNWNGLQLTQQEYNQYGVEEGVFFGDILNGSANAYMHACIGVDQAIDDTQSDLPYRKCATGTSYCNFANQGNCADVCSGRDGGNSWTSCGSTHDANGVMVYLNGQPD
jgi:hypothetical protein|nr:hypothetical protein [Kofleriaceae bacterium]